MTRPGLRPPAGTAGMRRPAERRERGVVLVMVLVVVAVINFLVLDLNANMFVVQRATHTADRRTIAFYNAQSAVSLGRLALVLQGLINGQLGGSKSGSGLDMTPWSSMLFDFFGNESSRNTLLQTFAGIPGDLVRGFAVLDGNFAVTLVDEDGRINLNLAAQGDESQQFLDRVLSWLVAPIQYDDLFATEAADGQITTREQFVAAAIDWADTNDQMYQRAGASRGAEDNGYESLPEPYKRKDCPYDSIEELRRVRGVGEDFWSTFVEPVPEDPDSRTLTVWGQGKININTAPARVLAAVICALALDQTACDPRNFDRVLSLVDSIEQLGGGRFSSPGQFVRAVSGGIGADNTSGLDAAPGIAIDGSLADKWLTAQGKVFSLYVEGRAPIGGRPAGVYSPEERSGNAENAREAVEEQGAERGGRPSAGSSAAPPPPPGGETAADGGTTGPGGATGAGQSPQRGAVDRDVIVRFHVVLDTTSPWDQQGGRILYWREL